MKQAEVFVAYSSNPEKNMELACLLHERIECLRRVNSHIIPEPEDAGKGLSEKTLEAFERCHIFLPVVSNKGRFSSAGLNQELGYAAKVSQVGNNRGFYILPFVDVPSTDLGLLDATTERGDLIKISAESQNFEEVNDDEKIFEVIENMARRLEEMKVHEDTWIIQKRCNDCGHLMNSNAMRFGRLCEIRNKTKLKMYCDGCGSEYSLDPLTFEVKQETKSKTPGVEMD